MYADDRRSSAAASGAAERQLVQPVPARRRARHVAKPLSKQLERRHAAAYDADYNNIAPSVGFRLDAEIPATASSAK